MGVPTYRNILYNGAPITIGSILFKENLVEFVIDTADLSAVEQFAWHFTSNTLATTIVDTRKREVCMHTLIMAPDVSEVVQHISGNGLDNRRCNLRCIDKREALLNRAQKKRSIELPPMCGLNLSDIPRHIWYVQANGYHRDRFAIEFKTEKILWKSTSSKEVSLQEKLEQAKARLSDLYSQYPHLDPAREEDAIRLLQNSFDEIIHR